MDIWNEEYKVKSVKVYPGCLHLKVNQQGEVNYDIFKPTEDTTSSPFKFELQKVKLEDVRFSYENKLTAQTYRTAISEMDLAGDFTEKQFSLKAESKLKVEKAKSGEITLLSNLQASFDLQLNVDQEKGIVSLNDALIYISNLPFKVNGFA